MLGGGGNFVFNIYKITCLLIFNSLNYTNYSTVVPGCMDHSLNKLVWNSIALGKSFQYSAEKRGITSNKVNTIIITLLVVLLDNT